MVCAVFSFLYILKEEESTVGRVSGTAGGQLLDRR